MGMGKPKQFTRPPPKKKSAKPSAFDTEQDYQDAADFEEAAGGKHRAGDSVKAGRAFVRALEIYDKALMKYPSSFDLAYNKARLQLELAQQPALIDHIGVELLDWLQATLTSHRTALRLHNQNPDVLFNTAQVLTSLAEQLGERDQNADAVVLLQEALELLSSCLSTQEMAYEQHQLDFPDTEEGGVALGATEPLENTAPTSDVDMDEANQQSAVVETPVGPSDLLDTVHASLSALTTLAPLSDESALQTLGDMARQLTESKAPDYIRLLPADSQDKARLSVAMDRATFIAAYASAQFEHQMIELQTYAERLDAFDVPGKDEDADALVAESEARTELVLSAIDRFEESPNLPATICWKQLSLAQELCSKAAKLSSDEAQKSKAEIYQSKGDLELLRHRLVHIPKTDLADSIRSSAQTLIQNAQTFYKGAVGHAKSIGDDKVEREAQERWDLARAIAALLHGGEPLPPSAAECLMEALEECVDEGLISEGLADALRNERPVASRS